MVSRTAVRILLACVVCLATLSLSGMFQAKAYQPAEGKSFQKKTKQAQAVKPRKAASRVEEQGLRKAVEGYCAAFNKADVDALMKCWTDDAEYINESGKAYRGKPAIRRLLTKSLADNKGAKQSIKIHSIRFVKPDVVIEDGSVFMTSPEGDIEPGHYSAVWLKQGNKWLINCIRDLPSTGDTGRPAAYGKLKQLAWMVGEWQEKGPKSEVCMTCRWGPNQTFLFQEFTALHADGKHHSTQIIGWDPYNECIRSWLFDSSGGFGEGYWTRKGNTWEVQKEGILADGRTGSAINTWKFIDDATVEWSAMDREANELPLPDLKVTLIRKAKE